MRDRQLFEAGVFEEQRLLTDAEAAKEAGLAVAEFTKLGMTPVARHWTGGRVVGLWDKRQVDQARASR